MHTLKLRLLLVSGAWLLVEDLGSFPEWGCDGLLPRSHIDDDDDDAFELVLYCIV